MEGLEISSAQFWISAMAAVAADALLLRVLTWRIQPYFFSEMRWTLVGTAAAAWTGFSMLLVQFFWDEYYRYLFPPAFRSGGLLLFVPLTYGLVAWLLHWLSLRMPGHPILAFSLLGGVESLVEHLWGFYGLKALEIPALQGASLVSILAFAVPEYIFYWSIVIAIAALLHSLGGRFRPYGKVKGAAS